MTDGRLRGKWRDLRTRVISAAVLIVVALLAAYAGPRWFGAMIVVISGLMVWELSRMLTPRAAWMPVILGVFSAAVVALAVRHGREDSLPLLALLPGLGVWAVSRENGLTGGAYGVVVALTGIVLVGLPPMKALPIILIVVVTDIAGYFAGKSIGGKKFWPSISPKKTWAGIVAGWLCSALLGLWAVMFLDAHPGVIVIAVGMSFASQMGDIVESAFKRRAGVKDSSGLIPGHGGFLDRFDGIVGATVVLAIGMLLVDF
jgi:phosphatidate cytidylyltransferase